MGKHLWVPYGSIEPLLYFDLVAELQVTCGSVLRVPLWIATLTFSVPKRFASSPFHLSRLLPATLLAQFFNNGNGHPRCPCMLSSRSHPSRFSTDTRECHLLEDLASHLAPSRADLEDSDDVNGPAYAEVPRDLPIRAPNTLANSSNCPWK